MLADLKQYWQSALEAAKIESSAKTDQYFAEIQEAYASYGRHYHNQLHLEELFQMFEEYRDQLHDPVIVAFAIFYHDVIYNRLIPAANERRSAALAAKQLKEIGLAPEQTQAVYDLIMDTKEHQIVHASKVLDAALFLDMDLAILAAPRERYAEYIRQIRREYGHIPTRFFNKARLEFLQSTYQQAHIYQTELFQSQFEVQARRNIEIEMAFLSRRD